MDLLALADFARRHPDVRLEVTTEDRAVDMVEEGYDLVIGVNPEIDETLVGRIFLRDRLVVVASPNLSRSGKAAVSAVVRTQGGKEWKVAGPRDSQRIAFEPVLTLSSLVMVRDAVRTGIGAGCLPISLVSHDLAAGTLVHWATWSDRRSPFGRYTLPAAC